MNCWSAACGIAGLIIAETKSKNANMKTREVITCDM